MVKVDETWHVARALQKCFDGVNYDDWSETARKLRQRYQEEARLNEKTIADALRRIIEINAREEKRFGVALHALTPAGLNRAKEDLFLGLSIEPKEEFNLPPDDDLFGRVIPLEDGRAQVSAREERSSKESDVDDSLWDFDDDE